MSRDARDMWNAILGAVSGADDVVGRASVDIMGIYERMAPTPPAEITHAWRQQFLREIDPVIRRYFGDYGPAAFESELYKSIVANAERTYLTQLQRGLDDLDTIMQPYSWWPEQKRLFQSAGFNVAQTDRLVSVYQMLYGDHVTRQRILNARLYQPLRTWRDARGYTLSTRVWRQSRGVYSHIDSIMREGIRNGWSADKIARELRHYVDPTWARSHYRRNGTVVRTRTAAGTRANATSAARRLARTEITRVHGEGAKERARSVPGIRGLRLRLSAQHPRIDICDDYAAADNYGLGAGVYPVDAVDWYPLHPGELCALVPAHMSREETRRLIVDKYRQEAVDEVDAMFGDAP